MTPGQHVAGAAGGHAGVAGGVECQPLAVGDDRAVSFQNHDRAAVLGQLPGLRLALMGFWRALAGEPREFAGVRGQDARTAVLRQNGLLGGQRVQGIGVEHRRLR